MDWFLNQLLPKGKVALCFSDPAGTNACLALAMMYKIEGYPVPLLFSNKQYKGTVQHDFDITVSEVIPDWAGLKTTLLFTGTSHPQSSDSFEVNCIAKAKKQRVRVISFVDHWINFKLRFQGLTSAQYPDEIWVIDESAKELAIKEGLPAQILVVSGNPYHTFLKNYWKPLFEGKKYLTKLGIDVNRKHILFAPDPLSLRLNKGQNDFTEGLGLEDLIKVISSMQVRPLLLVKLHPLQPLAIINKIIDNCQECDVVLLQGVNIPELIYAVDVVVGFFSNILLDALAIGKKVIRYFPGDPNMDLLRYTTVNADLVTTCPDLHKAVDKVLSI